MHLFVTFLLVVVDQVSKIWVARTLPLGGPDLPVGLGFHLTYVRNTGAAFGIFQEGTLILGILSALVSLMILFHLLRQGAAMPALQRWAFALILAGAIGNMIDRFRLGYVIDFIHFYIPGVFSYPVFNVADICVVVGAGLLIITSFRAPESSPELSDADTNSHR